MLRNTWIVLGAVALFTTSAGAASVAVGDFNGDGRQDLVTARKGFAPGGGSLEVLLGNGDGTFVGAVSYPSSDQDYGATSVAVGDFNRDGRQDIVAANFGSLTVLLGNGDGTFAGAVRYSLFGSAVSLSVVVSDLNGDGHQDLVTADWEYSPSFLRLPGTVLLGHGDGTFAAPVQLPFASLTARVRDIAAGDFDGNGVQDLVAGSWFHGQCTVTALLGYGDGSFAVGAQVSGCLESVAVSDFNGDGRQDLVSASGGIYPTGYYKPVYGDDFIYWESLLPHPWSGPYESRVPPYDGGSVWVQLGQGDGTFASGGSYDATQRRAYYCPEGDPCYDLCGDMDGDGFWDCLASTSSVAVGDFNRDGRQDLVTANTIYYEGCSAYGLDWCLEEKGGDISVLLGNGDGTFAAPVSYPSAATSSHSVAVGDFDGNGWQDAVAVDFWGSVSGVTLNPGRPTLTVGLDIKPDSFPNVINPYSRGVIPVAIIGSDTFDVADVDVTTLAFGPSGASIAHLNGHLQDVNYDGIMDLMLHFRTQETGIACGDESASLTGELLDGQPFEGTDSITTVGCRNFGQPSIWLKDEERLSQPRRGGIVDVEQD